MKYEEFLNPKSMITPGFAGALCMVFVNALCNNFDALNDYRAHLALTLSFGFGLLVFIDKTTQLYARIILYLFNSLIVFSMATGTNAIGNENPTKEDPINETIPTIERVGMVEELQPNRYVFVQNIDSSSLRKKELQDIVLSASALVQSLQKQIKSQTVKYNNPAQKFNTLKDINTSLLMINNSIKSQDIVSSVQEERYQKDLLEVQHNLGVLQSALLLEEKQNKSRFFKPWFKN